MNESGNCCCEEKTNNHRINIGDYLYNIGMKNNQLDKYKENKVIIYTLEMLEKVISELDLTIKSELILGVKYLLLIPTDSELYIPTNVKIINNGYMICNGKMTIKGKVSNKNLLYLNGSVHIDSTRNYCNSGTIEYGEDFNIFFDGYHKNNVITMDASIRRNLINTLQDLKKTNTSETKLIQKLIEENNGNMSLFDSLLITLLKHEDMDIDTITDFFDNKETILEELVQLKKTGYNNTISVDLSKNIHQIDTINNTFKEIDILILEKEKNNSEYEKLEQTISESTKKIEEMKQIQLSIESTITHKNTKILLVTERLTLLNNKEINAIEVNTKATELVKIATESRIAAEVIVNQSGSTNEDKQALELAVENEGVLVTLANNAEKLLDEVRLDVATNQLTIQMETGSINDITKSLNEVKTKTTGAITVQLNDIKILEETKNKVIAIDNKINILKATTNDVSKCDINALGEGKIFAELVEAGVVTTKEGATQKELCDIGGKTPLHDAKHRFAQIYVNHPDLSMESSKLINSLNTTRNEEGEYMLKQVQNAFPTNGIPSPMEFTINGVTKKIEPWTQLLYRCEEFGQSNISELQEDKDLKFPGPDTPDQFVDDEKINVFLEKTLTGTVFSKPQENNNENYNNPWANPISKLLKDDGFTGTIEGRSGKHLDWNKPGLEPRKMVNTVILPAKSNNGVRDKYQYHNYLEGEFAVGGLYHTTFALLDANGNPIDNTEIKGTTHGIPVAVHPNAPIQEKDTLWTFDGTFPLKVAMERAGEPIVFRLYNGLPIDVSKNKGYGANVITLHRHNGHVRSVSDGFASRYFFPGQYYDYHWSMIVSGHDNPNNPNPEKCGMPLSPGEPAWLDGGDHCQSMLIPGDYRNIMSSHWAHDHMVDHTHQNVYKGMAMVLNIYSTIDRGCETFDDGINLRLPSGCNKRCWGCRDYDINLAVFDRAWDKDGQIWLDPFKSDGFLGDKLLVNYQYKPVLKVRPRRYRFRFLSCSISRILQFAFVVKRANLNGKYKGPLDPEGVSATYTYDPIIPYMIANDGNLMEHAVAEDGSVYDPMRRLSEAGVLGYAIPAHRQDVIIDFADNNIKEGDEIYIINTMSHKVPHKLDRPISLQDILNGEYTGDPCVGKFMKMIVVGFDPETIQGPKYIDPSMDPKDYTVGGKQMIPIHRPTTEELINCKVRTFKFSKSGGGWPPWKIETCDDRSISKDDPTKYKGEKVIPYHGGRISMAPVQDSGEIWRIKSGGGWTHPVHIHVEEGIVLSADGKKPSTVQHYSRGDVFGLGAGMNQTIDLFYRFRDISGQYMMHCHNNVHEDMAMMLRWDILQKGVDPQPFSCPVPTWDKITYKESYTLPSWIKGCPDRAGEITEIMNELAKL